MSKPIPRGWVRISLAVAAALALGTPLRAQEPGDNDTLPDLVVTADRLPTPSDKVSATTTVIRGEELRERGVYFVQDALREVPGVAIVPTGSFGGTTSLFLRGGESDYAKVLIDGVPVNDPGGSFDWGSLSTDNVERIEVLRGPGSVLYGSDAVTGVIQIFTRRAAGRTAADLTTRAGSLGSWHGAASLRGGGDRAGYSLSLSRLHTDGTYDFNSAFGSTVATGLLELSPDEHTDVMLTARLADNTAHFPTDFAGVPSDSNAFTFEDATTVGLEATRRLSPRAELRLFLASHAETDGTDDQPDGPADTTGFFMSSDQAELVRRSADARGILQLGRRVRLIAGAQLEYQRLREENRAAFNFGGGPGSSGERFAADRRTYAGYVQSSMDLAGNATVNAGVRLDENQHFGTFVTWRAGMVYRVAPATRLRLSAGTAFKEPTFREQFARTPFEVGNPDLDVERSRGWEVGAEQDLFDGRLTLGATWFDQRFRNLIQFNGSAAPGEPTYANVARALSRGLEARVDLRPLRAVSLRASYTRLDTEVQDAGFSSGSGDAFVEGEPLIRRPRHSLRMDGRVHLVHRLIVGAAVQRVGSRTDVDFNAFPSVRRVLDAYTLVDLDASLLVLQGEAGRPGVTGTLRLENLFEEEYETILGFPGRGRTVLAGARVMF